MPAAGNPLLWGKGGGSYSAADAAAEVGGTETDHIPTVLALVVVASGVLLLVLQRTGFRFVAEASGGRG
jgi:hypothetical protein